jgi:hypothetical protein
MNQAEQQAPDQADGFAEMRSAPRSSLMCRTGKILCESGEYVCVVRDVSATGAKLRLFHPVPPDEHLFLELANGDRYAMERVWVRGDHAGFRFSCTIDVDRFIAEPAAHPRRPIRLNLRRPADARADGIVSPVVLLDLSQQGARIEAGRKFALEQKLWLTLEDQAPRFGCVRWRRGYSHGLVLQQSLGLEQLAQCAFALQPFAPAADYGDPPPAARYA